MAMVSHKVKMTKRACIDLEIKRGAIQKPLIICTPSPFSVNFANATHATKCSITEFSVHDTK